MPRINFNGRGHLKVLAPCQKMDAIALVTVGLFACGFTLYVLFHWRRNKAISDRVLAEMAARLNQRIKKTEANQS